MKLLAFLYYRESLRFIQPFSLTFVAPPCFLTLRIKIFRIEKAGQQVSADRLFDLLGILSAPPEEYPQLLWWGTPPFPRRRTGSNTKFLTTQETLDSLIEIHHGITCRVASGQTLTSTIVTYGRATCCWRFSNRINNRTSYTCLILCGTYSCADWIPSTSDCTCAKRV